MMKTNNPLSFLFLLLISILFFQTACKKTEHRAKPMSAKVNAYVYAYTSGTISKTSTVKVRFTNPVVDKELIGTDVDQGIINFKPSIKGQAIWEDERTLTFEPENPFASKTNYVATVQLKKLYNNVPAAAGSFDFEFQIAELFFDVIVDGMEAANSNDLTKQLITGQIRFSDVADADDVNKLLEAKQGGKALPVSIEAASIPNTYQFTVSGVNRASQEASVDLSWNGKSMDVSSKGEEQIIIPALGDFKIIDAKVKQGNNQEITLHFSDPLLKNQNLKGLINIDGYNGGLKYTIDGNSLHVFPNKRLAGSKTISVATGVKNINSVKMKNLSNWNLSFESIDPQVRTLGEGVIVPNTSGLIFPFEAVNLSAIDLEIVKIFDNNILQFLQTNQLNGSGQLQRVGRIVFQKKIALAALNASANSAEWTRYALDLKPFLSKDPNAIYQLRIGFRKSYANYTCEGDDATTTTSDNMTLADDPFENNGEIKSIWGGYYGIDGYYSGYTWRHRKNPCFPAYYNSDNFISRNIVSSNLGIIAKGGRDGSIQSVVTDLRTAKPLSNVRLEYYDYTQQLIDAVTTDNEGKASIDLERPPFVVIANQGEEKGYLKLKDGDALSVSRFDVSGAIAQKGLKGYIYGDRGVWRPGDSLFLNFVLEDKEGKLPMNYPVKFELTDPRGQVHFNQSSSESVNSVYPFHINTSSEDPTGDWIAKVKAGGAVFTKVLKIETVKPNRLKLNLDFGAEYLSASTENLQGNLQVNWLHGAPGQNLKAKVEMQLRATQTKFNQYNQYNFDDPSRSFSSDPQVIFDSSVNSDGYASVNTSINTNQTAPGKLKANFKVRAFEKGGDFSTDNFSMDYSPFSSYTGLITPKNKYGSKRLNVNKPGEFTFVALDENGKALSGKNLSVGLYRVQWRWWWDGDEDHVSKFNSSNHYNAKQKKTVVTNNRGEANWTLSVERWGRYMVRVCDEDSGHCSGDFFYAGYPWYEDGKGNKSAASMLAVTADKDKYNVGETVELLIPMGEEGRALISIENGSKVVKSFWVDAKKGENVFKFETTKEMSPNVFANVSLIQPHGQVKNDLPIRMYGIVRVNVEDKTTRLHPEIKMADELEPEQTFTLEVSEASGQPMAYTIAVVDDGLLDLTRFKTPNPWDAFFAPEALGVKTWDIYDDVLGAYGAQLERILSVGGDDAAAKKDAKKANRFKPVVMHLGPFELGKKGKAKHKLSMPNYIGSVRAMVVATGNGAYGNAEKTLPVRKPLMILATLPRVLGPTETLKLPVNVFAMDKKVKDVTITVEETGGFANFLNTNSQTIHFNKMGDQIVNFDMKMNENIGIAKFKITAKSAGEIATQEIELDVRNPNPYVTNIQKEIVETGKTWDLNFEAVGMTGTNKATLEVSNIPPIDLGRRLDYLIRYPHGCIEQTTSSGFPQLFVGQLIDLSEKQKNEIPENIKSTIDRLKRFQTSDGGFAYWPGDSHSSEWGTNYAGHFMLEAKEAGYSIPTTMLSRWKKHQKRNARNWSRSTDYYRQRRSSELMQAYRLYGLAKAGAAELGAMNRLRETADLTSQAKWRLAAAYAVIGKTDVAQAVIQNLKTDVKDYIELSYTYGSGLRDRAMILETLILMNGRKAAADVCQEVAKKLSANRWYGTQTVAYSLMAVAKFTGGNKTEDRLAFTYKVGNGQSIDAGSDRPVMLIDVPVDGNANRTIQLHNSTKGVLFARLISSGQPLIGDQTATANNLKLTINYKTMDGSALDISQIPQGKDFIAEVHITNPGTKGMRYDEMALTQIFPSGWEIHNSRMDNVEGYTDSHRAEYQDIRDDRIYTYFDINQNKTHVYRFQLNAAYQGRYYLPTVKCEAMYDNTISARQPGQWVEVVGATDL